jgi:CheY-like chemotaxis protein
MRAVCRNSVLLVDDDPALRKLLTLRLRKHGFETREAEDGIDGVVKLRQEIPKVIVADLDMPRMSGFEFISVVRRRFPTIPVVALSGSLPGEFSPETTPDRWFAKGMQGLPNLMKAIDELARQTPDHVDAAPVVSTPVRIRRASPDNVLLICTDCLRAFAASEPGNDAAEGIAICTYCGAHIPFLVEDSGGNP